MVFADLNKKSLDPEQKEMLDELASKGGVNLVAGPPGCGKTVLAYFLANRVVEEYDPSKYPEESSDLELATLIMHNKVLKSFVNKDLETFTGIEFRSNLYVVNYYYNLLNRLWRMAFCPARCRKEDGKLSRCHCYRSQRIPMMPRIGDEFPKIDFNAYLKAVAEQPKEIRDRFHFGHLVVDEGQDFPKEFFVFINLMRGLWREKSPSITVFADENQIINEENSSIEEMLTTMNIDRKNLKKLTKNYRNTKEIYHFASHFKTREQETDEPERTGMKPRVVLTESTSESVDYILKVMTENRGKNFLLSIGSRSGSRIFNSFLSQIETHLQRTDQGITGYRSLRDYDNALVVDAKDLNFEKNNIVQVFDQSSKGIEADIVFYCGLENYDINDPISIRKKMYVNATRAKEQLHFIIEEDEQNPRKELIGFFPDPRSSGGSAPLCEFITYPREKDISNYLEEIAWHVVDAVMEEVEEVLAEE